MYNNSPRLDRKLVAIDNMELQLDNTFMLTNYTPVDCNALSKNLASDTWVPVAGKENVAEQVKI